MINFFKNKKGLISPKVITLLPLIRMVRSFMKAEKPIEEMMVDICQTISSLINADEITIYEMKQDISDKDDYYCHQHFQFTSKKSKIQTGKNIYPIEWNEINSLIRKKLLHEKSVVLKKQNIALEIGMIQFFFKEEINQVVISPLFINNKIWGIICLGFFSTKEIRFDELNVIKMVLSIVGSLIAREFISKKLQENYHIIESTNHMLEEYAHKADQLSKSKSVFLANMSHEIRTPMNGVLGMTELLHRTDLNKQQMEYVSTIYRSSQALMTILNDILDFSKMEADTIILRPHPFSLKEITEEVVFLLETMAVDKNLELIYRFDPEIPIFLKADAGRLRQIMINLISNGIKYTREGIIALEISCIQKNNKDCTLAFVVNDTGIGIPDSKLESIFEKFSRIENKDSETIGGAGLGLSISQNLLSKMNSKLEVKSNLGIGSQFSFIIKIPLLNDREIEDYKSNLVVENENYPQWDKQILVVEDSPINQKVAIGILSLFGVSITVVSDGQEAVNISEKRKFDLILMDCRMPVMDGFTATQEIRKSDGPNKETPIVALTANILGFDKEKCLSHGMDDYIMKPFLPKDFIQIFTRLFATSKISVENRVHKTTISIPPDKKVIIDEDFYSLLFKDDVELKNEIINELELTYTKFISNAKNALKEKDFKMARDIFHRIKGDLVNASSLFASKIAGELEEDSLKEIINDVDPRIHELNNGIEELIETLKTR